MTEVYHQLLMQYEAMVVKYKLQKACTLTWKNEYAKLETAIEEAGVKKAVDYTLSFEYRNRHIKEDIRIQAEADSIEQEMYKEIFDETD